MEKNLQCPMCNSSDFKEEDGYYICQICGNKIPIMTNENNKLKTDNNTKKTNFISEKDSKVIKMVSLFIELSLFLGTFFIICLNLSDFEYLTSYSKMVYIFDIFYCLILIVFIVFLILEWRGKVISFVAKTCLFVICCLLLFIPAFISLFKYLSFNGIFSVCAELLTLYLIIYQCPKWSKYSS